MTALPCPTEADLEATLARAFCRAAPDAETEETAILPFYGPVFAPAAEPALEPPDDIPAWLTGYRWDNLDDLEAALADVTGAARDLRWQQADMCAAAWLAVPDRKARRALLGRIGSVLMCSARTAERRAWLGLTYPPELRVPDVSQRVYLAALRAADPCAVVEAALRFGWSEREVAEHIDTGRAPTRRVVVLDASFPFQADPEEIADAVYRAICDEHAQAGTRTPLEQRVRVVFVYETQMEHQGE